MSTISIVDSLNSRLNSIIDDEQIDPDGSAALRDKLARLRGILLRSYMISGLLGKPIEEVLETNIQPSKYIKNINDIRDLQKQLIALVEAYSSVLKSHVLIDKDDDGAMNATITIDTGEHRLTEEETRDLINYITISTKFLDEENIFLIDNVGIILHEVKE